MKRLLMSTVVSAAFLLPGVSTPISASENPIFGNAKVATLSTDAARKVTAKGGTTAYYLYYGLYYTSYAVQYAGLAQYYNWYGYNGSSGATTSYAYNAYYYSYYATQNFYNAYYYSYFGS